MREEVFEKLTREREKFAEKEESAERRAPHVFPANRKISERDFLLPEWQSVVVVVPKNFDSILRKISSCHDGADFPSFYLNLRWGCYFFTLN